MNKITSPLKIGMEGAAVADLQDALRELLERSAILANNEDLRKALAVELKLERLKETYGDITNKVVYVFQEENGLDKSGQVDDPTAGALNALLEKWGLLDLWVVSGRIVSHELRGLTGQLVLAVDKNVGSEVQLGVGTSGERGAYEIHYSVAGIEKAKPDVQVQATDENGKILAVSAVRYNASPVESGLDILIPAEKLPSEAEYDRLIGELGAHLGNPNKPDLKKRLSKLKEDDEQQDITYLANKTGWDARMVAMTSLASQFGERTDIEPEFYYALFRSGVPANEAVLSQMAPETVREAWERAIERQILPAELKEKIPQNLKKFKERYSGALLSQPAQIGASSFKELIETTLEGDDKQQDFAELYYDQREDLEGFWEAVRTKFPEEADRLQLNGKLAFLTTNNAPLIHKLHAQHSGLQTPLDLVRKGLYRREAWQELLDEDVPVPGEIPGQEPEEKRSNYAAVMASQLRLSYPTAVVAEMVRTDTIPLRVEPSVKTAVTEFLDAYQGKFELGVHPVEQYLRKNDIVLEEACLDEIKKLQRVYQISPSDEIAARLMDRGLDSAGKVMRYDEQTFVSTFKDELGGEPMARLTYAKAHQVHHAVLNIATAYLLEKSAPPLYAINNLPATSGAKDSDVLAYSTLEGIFGEMDYCGCEHCRSWLSPAAYLVDLLQFLDPPTPPELEKENPLDVLLGRPPDVQGRRPDIQHLQLTCENTNRVLPYIDLVNEVLEHYVVDGSLNDFAGHNTSEGTTTEELLATPQFVSDAAYAKLRDQVFPPPLPFHQPLEAARRYFDHFDVPLHEAMERLRRNDNLERDGSASETAYGWRDILMERLHLSRPEYALLTDSSTSLQELYGEDPSRITVNDLINHLYQTDDDEPQWYGIGNAKLLGRKIGITYEELIEIIHTRFINPRSHLIPKLEKLGVDFATIQDFLDGTLPEEEFKALLPINDLDMTQYGGSAEQSVDEKFTRLQQWLRDNEAHIKALIAFSDPTGSEDICSFDTVELRYALPDAPDQPLRPVELLKLLRFIRLWSKLGWSIEQTDEAIAALYPADQHPTPADDYDTAGKKLDAGFQCLLLRLGHLKTVMEELKLTPKRNLSELLACWSSIDTRGYRSLYRQMFLNPTILALDEVFQEDGYGNYLNDATRKLKDHTEVLRAAFNLAQEELDLILGELGFNENTVLNLENISAVFRYGYLARKLRISVRELLALKAMSGLDPFLPLAPALPSGSLAPLRLPPPPMIRFIDLVQRVKASPLKVSQLLYHLQHVDLSGKASPSNEEVLSFARALRNDLRRIDREHAAQPDPTGEIARAEMALVYGDETADKFFGLLNNTSTFDVAYKHGQPALENDILVVTDRIAYDDFQERLSFQGVMTAADKMALDGVASATPAFRDAVKALFDDGQKAFAAFFDRYPDLKGLYENFVASSAPTEEKMSALLADFLPDLRARLKRQQVRQTVSAQVGADLTLVTPLLENASVLHAVGDPAEPAINDFLALETEGLGAPTNGLRHGYLEAPDNGSYKFYVEADAGADVSLLLDGVGLKLVPSNGIWQQQSAIELQAGRLYKLELVAPDELALSWERKGMGRTPIPSAQLFPARSFAHFRTSYLRLIKTLAIADALALSSAELVHFTTHEDYLIDDEGWLNVLPVAPFSAGTTTQTLLENLSALLQYRALKEKLKIPDERLLEILQDPFARGEDEEPLFSRVTHWQDADMTPLLAHFGMVIEDSALTHLDNFARLYEAFAVVEKLGIGAAALIANTTNEATAETLRALQAVLRARHDQSAWLKLIQRINDELRSLQRDALVAYVLYQLGQNGATRHIDTPDKLFEHFLIDVQMDPCMKTSRIKQAISSVQLFIQRCLLNLEPRVASSSIKAKQWEWMKRYRVWEANRKVFLWPENWLEPELRDNKSPFFKDLESELLQSDITDDAAASALVHYLEKLDEVAKLEICGMYYEENELDNEEDEVVHVIARTAGARRTYYYRRQDGSTSWSPWEKIDLNIEDNPVLPVVWKGRFFLFWLSVMQETEPTSSGGNTSLDLTNVSRSELRDVADEAKTRVTVTLYWSEYYHGKWQPARTSDVNKPLTLDVFIPSGTDAFDRVKLKLRSLEASSGELKIIIDYSGKFTPYSYQYFKLYNTHTLPIVSIRSKNEREAEFERQRMFSSSLTANNVPLSIAYLDHSISETQVFERIVLNKGVYYECAEPRHYVSGIFKAPFFYQDPKHAFFVRSKESMVSVGGFIDVSVVNPPEDVVMVPPVVVKPDFTVPQDEVLFLPDSIKPGVIDPRPVTSFLRVDPYIHFAIGTAGTISFGDRRVGPGGSIETKKIIR